MPVRGGGERCERGVARAGPHQHTAERGTDKLTKRGPALIELACRLAGASLPRHFSSATNHPSIDSFCDLLLDRPAFRARSAERSYVQRFYTIIFLRSLIHGVLKSTPTLDEFGALKTKAHLEWSLEVGEELSPTQDLFSTPGLIVLHGQSPEQLALERQMIRSVEEEVLRRHITAIRSK